MTDAKDLSRMVLSRKTLHAYLRAGSDAIVDPVMISDEIGILKGLIETYPDKADTLNALIAEWRDLVRDQLH